jgi:hypothetical protein
MKLCTKLTVSYNYHPSRELTPEGIFKECYKSYVALISKEWHRRIEVDSIQLAEIPYPVIKSLIADYTLHRLEMNHVPEDTIHLTFYFNETAYTLSKDLLKLFEAESAEGLKLWKAQEWVE